MKNMASIQRLLGLMLFTMFCFYFSSYAHAVPSFARQTGMPCSSCHVQSFGIGLTPAGRNFKLRGYTAKKDYGEKSFQRYVPPISAMIRGSFTHTNDSQPGGAADRFGSNNNATIDEASLFLAGRITSNVGTFYKELMMVWKTLDCSIMPMSVLQIIQTFLIMILFTV